MQVINGTLNLAGTSPTITSGTFSQQSPTASPLTNVMNLDPFFSTLNVTGQVGISLQFEDFPTASFSLITDSPTVAANLKTRFTNFATKHVFYGMPFRVSSYNESISPFPNKRYEISIQMEGWNKYPVEKEVTLTFGKSTLNYRLQNVAEKAGVKITNINKYIPLNGQLKLSTNVRNVINILTTNLGLDVDYTRDQITLTRHGTNKTISITEDKILNLQCTYNQANVEGFKYNPRYLEWNKKTTADYVAERLQLETKPRYTRVTEHNTIVINDPNEAEKPPNETVTLRNMSLNFDSSGETKTKEINTYRGQKIISTEVFTYGFAYLSSQITQDNITGWHGDGAPYWKLIEHYTITYLYDDVDGYLLGHTKVGSKLTRFQTETDEGEHKRNLADAAASTDATVIASSQQMAALYEFRWIPITEEERIELQSYHTTYTDSQIDYEQLNQTYEEFDQRLGRYVTKYAKNLSYSVPMHIIKRSLFSNSFAYTIAPKADPTQYTTNVTTGEQKKELYQVKILDSKNVRFSGSTEDDKYTETTSVWTSQDANFANSFSHVTSNTASGKPPQAQLYPIYQPYEIKNNVNSKNQNKQKYIVYSSNYSGNKIANDSVYFDVETKEEALFALKTQLEKQNTFNVNDFTFTTLFDLNLIPGYKCVINYNGTKYEGVIKNVNIPITILNGTIAKCFMTVSCGRILPSNSVNLEVIPEQLNPTPDLFLPTPYTHGDAAEVDQIYNNVSQRSNY